METLNQKFVFVPFAGPRCQEALNFCKINYYIVNTKMVQFAEWVLALSNNTVRQKNAFLSFNCFIARVPNNRTWRVGLPKTDFFTFFRPATPKKLIRTQSIPNQNYQIFAALSRLNPFLRWNFFVLCILVLLLLQKRQSF